MEENDFPGSVNFYNFFGALHTGPMLFLFRESFSLLNQKYFKLKIMQLTDVFLRVNFRMISAISAAPVVLVKLGLGVIFAGFFEFCI